MNKRLYLCFVLLLSLVINLQAQQKPAAGPISAPPSNTQKPNTSSEQDQDLVRINTNLVQIDVVVTKNGKRVTNLKPEDFEIFQDGRAQNITQFSYISNAPVVANPPSTASAAMPADRTGPIVAPALIAPGKARRTIALVVDDLGTSFESMARIRTQLRRFLDEQLQPDDLVAIIKTGGEVGALQQFTTDKRLLRTAIENLKWNHCSRVGARVLEASHPFDFKNENPCVVNSLHNTLTALRFILRGMRDLPGRKSMAILADNLPTEQRELFDPNSIIKSTSRQGQKLPIKNIISNSLIELDELQGVVEMAIRSSVVIYGIDVGGLQTTGINAADEIYQPPMHLVKAGQEPTILIMRERFKALRENREGAELLASQTGGFVVHNTNEFELQKVMDDQSGYYLIGYRPSEETFNRRLHHIKARVKRAGLTVRTRDGFFGVTEEQARARELAPGDQMNRALTSPFEANDIPVGLTTFFVNESTTGSQLRSIISLDPRDLSFKEQPDGTHEAELDLSSIVFGNNGSVVNRKDQSATLRLRGEPYDRALRDGVVYGFDLPIEHAGAFQVRVAVRDKASSRLGVAGRFVEVPNLADGRLSLSGIVVKNETISRAQPSTNRVAVGGVTRRLSQRSFRQGSTLIFAYAIYNAQLNKSTALPDLRTQTRIFRDGKLVFTGESSALDVTGQLDLKRVNGAARFHLGPELPPGEYVLQIMVEDSLAKEKQRTATQLIDFEVVK